MNFQKVTDIRDRLGALQHLATKNEDARRRPGVIDRDSAYFELLSPFKLDVKKLLVSKALRRLQDKTQVLPDIRKDPHVRNRRSHTDEVVETAITLSDMLGLNTDLVNAITLGHDIGHTPFGHIGEKKISELTGKNFKHFIFSVVIAQHIERRGLGINLTHQTLTGMLQHSRGKNKATTTQKMSQESRLGMISDKIYTWSDISDIFYRNFMDLNEHPRLSYLIHLFGANSPQRVNNMVFEIFRESVEAREVIFQNSEAAQIFEEIKQYMYANIYPALNRDDMINPSMEKVYEYLGKIEPEADPAIILAIMTDEEVTTLAHTNKRDAEKIFSTLGVCELVPALRNTKIDFTNPDLDW